MCLTSYSRCGLAQQGEEGDTFWGPVPLAHERFQPELLSDRQLSPYQG